MENSTAIGEPHLPWLAFSAFLAAGAYSPWIHFSGDGAPATAADSSDKATLYQIA
jgi:hypothetical protein